MAAELPKVRLGVRLSVEGGETDPHFFGIKVIQSARVRMSVLSTSSVLGDITRKKGNLMRAEKDKLPEEGKRKKNLEERANLEWNSRNGGRLKVGGA